MTRENPTPPRGPRPAVLTIPAGVSFVEALAAGVLDQYGDDPLVLSRLLVLLPTRRATRTLREAFLRLTDGQPLVLPRMQPLGDVDEEALALSVGVADPAALLDLPPAIAPLERTMLLSRLVQAQSDDHDPASAFLLATALGQLLDQVQTEDLSLHDLKTLVPGDFAAHWQITLDFLAIIAEAWPRILAERQQLDPADRRNRLLRALAAKWQETPPEHPVIIAGSTGSIPASADLMKVVAFMPQGSVVLPGLVRDIDDDTWEAIGPTHPQFGMKQLLSRLAIDRAEVTDWPSPRSPANPARVRLLNEALRPAETLSAWQTMKVDKTAALKGFHRIDAPTRQAETTSIALILREALETRERTAALVTPDRDLARRVAVTLERWDITVDDSAGTPLNETPVGVFLRLIAEATLEDMAPVPLLAALKHPLCAAGQAPGTFRARVRAMERLILRGPRPAPGLDGITGALNAVDADAGLLNWWRDIAARWQPFAALFNAPDNTHQALVAGHIALGEALAVTDTEPAAQRLWAGDAGETLALFLSDLIAATGDAPPLNPHHYPALLDAALFGQVVRPAYGAHPRLSLLGPLEARLHHADVMILGGLNEDSWPPDPGLDPWMSRPMRARFGLPAPERRIGLSAHDFVQGASAPEVIITRAQKVGGAPTLPSRWLLRLDAVLDGRTIPAPPHRAWAETLDAADYDTPDALGPQPTPPVHARPHRLSVTQVERWMRDPYALYAQKVLNLSPLDTLDADPGAADRGIFIHEALDRFLKDGMAPHDPGAYDRLVAYGQAAFGAMLNRPLVRAFWWPRFEQIAAWFLETQQARALTATPVATERKGEMALGGVSGDDFVLSATADRIDRLATGGYDIIDYKTGDIPQNAKPLLAGYRPQLPLEAALLMAGAFPGIPAGTVDELSYWQLRGPAESNVIKSISTMNDIESIAALADDALAGLRRLVVAFSDEKTPYLSRPNPTEGGYGDYDHLARVKEWGQ